MYILNRPELSPEEQKLPLARFYNLPLSMPSPLQQQIIDAGPMDPQYAIRAQHMVDLLIPTGYHDVEYGYCMMDDGCGYIATYSVYPGCTPKMLAWYFRWLNVHTSGMPADKGNIKYKIWCPPDHYDHGFINGKNRDGGIYTVESLDLGQGEDKFYTVRHPFDLKQVGLTDELEQELKEAGCWLDCAWESFHTLDGSHRRLPATHLCLTMSRPHPLGGMEKCTREWIGYGIKDGKVWFDESTPQEMLCEDYLKKVLIHGTVEAQHLSKFLPELYELYHDKPDDMD